MKVRSKAAVRNKTPASGGGGLLDNLAGSIREGNAFREDNRRMPRRTPQNLKEIEAD